MEAIIAAGIMALIGPAFMAWLLNRQRRAEKQEDWKRQDEVASRVQEVAEGLVSNRSEVNDQLHEIHIAVNSTLTASLTGQLDALTILLSVLEDPELGSSGLVQSTKDKIQELKVQMYDRLNGPNPPA